VKSTSGDAYIFDCVTENHIAVGQISGDVSIEGSSAPDGIGITAISGDSEIKDCDFSYLHVYTTTGNTETMLKENASNYDITFNSVHGIYYMNGEEVEADGTFRQTPPNAERSIEIYTTNGSAWIND
jgi:hypothetical protein